MMAPVYNFFSSKTTYDQTRFEACKELVQINKLIVELHEKEIELDAAAKQHGAQSPDYSKHDIIKTLLDEMDRRITVFNESPVETASKEDDEKKKEKVRGAELGSICNLVEELQQLVNNVKNNNDMKTALAVHRNKNREIANTAVKTGVYTGSLIGTATIVPLSLFVTVPVAIYGAWQANKKVTKMTGLNNPLTRSEELINELAKTLDDAQKNLATTLMGMNLRVVKNVK